MKQHITEIKVKDPEKYYWKLRFLLNTVCASGAAVFRGHESDNILAQGWHIATNAAYYRIKDE